MVELINTRNTFKAKEFKSLGNLLLNSKKYKVTQSAISFHATAASAIVATTLNFSLKK